MEKIKWPDDIGHSHESLLFLREAYRKVRAVCSFEERIWLITANDGDMELYAEKLHRLAAKYGLIE